MIFSTEWEKVSNPGWARLRRGRLDASRLASFLLQQLRASSVPSSSPFDRVDTRGGGERIPVVQRLV